MSGGRWKSAPVSVSTARNSFPSFSMAACKRTTPMYSLPADCCDLTNRVALSMHTMRQPVTFGSSVPEWPVLICVCAWWRRWRRRAWRSGGAGAAATNRAGAMDGGGVDGGAHARGGRRRNARPTTRSSACNTRHANAHLLDAKDPLYPGHDLVRRRVSGLVQVDAPVLDVLIQWTLERRAAAWYGCVVRGADVQLIVVLQEQRPVVAWWRGGGRVRCVNGQNGQRRDGKAWRVGEAATQRRVGEPAAAGPASRASTARSAPRPRARASVRLGASRRSVCSGSRDERRNRSPFARVELGRGALRLDHVHRARGRPIVALALLPLLLRRLVKLRHGPLVRV